MKCLLCFYTKKKNGNSDLLKLVLDTQRAKEQRNEGEKDTSTVVLTQVCHGNTQPLEGLIYIDTGLP